MWWRHQVSCCSNRRKTVIRSLDSQDQTPKEHKSVLVYFELRNAISVHPTLCLGRWGSTAPCWLHRVIQFNKMRKESIIWCLSEFTKRFKIYIYIYNLIWSNRIKISWLLNYVNKNNQSACDEGRAATFKKLESELNAVTLMWRSDSICRDMTLNARLVIYELTFVRDTENQISLILSCGGNSESIKSVFLWLQVFLHANSTEHNHISW